MKILFVVSSSNVGYRLAELPHPQSSTDAARLLEDFWATNKVIGAICHGAIAMANTPALAIGKRATGLSRQEDAEIEKLYGMDSFPTSRFPHRLWNERAWNLATASLGAFAWWWTARW